jgi:hypothetical protein
MPTKSATPNQPFVPTRRAAVEAPSGAPMSARRRSALIAALILGWLMAATLVARHQNIQLLPTRTEVQELRGKYEWLEFSWEEYRRDDAAKAAARQAP